jgi:hypothetical protein
MGDGYSLGFHLPLLFCTQQLSTNPTAVARLRTVQIPRGIAMIEAVSLVLSVLALVVSGTTAWLTLFRRGTVRMTQPTVIFFGPDAPRSREDIALPKIYLRTLLFSTSKRGRIVESMHVALARNEMRQNFNIWVHGDGKLVRGSGLFVGETGVAANHHFLTPMDGSSFQFSSGRYCLEVYARLLGDQEPILLFSQDLEISSDLAARLKEPGSGLYFDWGPDSSRYLPHVEKRLPSPDPEQFLDILGIRMGSNTPQGTRLVPTEPSTTPLE